MPTGQEVADFLGRGSDTDLVSLASIHVVHVANLARAYTRGKGFVDGAPVDDIASVIVTATARLVTNPTLDKSESIGSYSVSAGSFYGWSLVEQSILNGYRRRAA